MSDDGLLRELGKELPYERPDDARREALRASLLVAATRREEPRPQRWRVVAAFGAGALAAAAIAMVVIGHRAPVAAVASENARIESSAAAELEHTVAKTATGTDEIVRVHAGKVGVVVAPVKAGERVVIRTGDAEIDGAGTYEVAVRDDKLAAVTVTAGIAKVVVTGHQAVFLAAGQAWHAESWTADLTPMVRPAPEPAAPTVAIVTPPAPPVPTVAPARIAHEVPSTEVAKAPTHEAASTHEATASPSAKPIESKAISVRSPKPEVTITTSKSDVAPKSTTNAPTPDAPAIATSVTAPEPTTPKPVAPSETEQHFQRGWRLLKDGKAIEAAAELGRAADGDGPLAVDARYFQAEALVKAGRKTEAEKALVGYLDHAQHSLRRGRAAVMLARLIAERGDKAAARNWFQSAVDDGDPAVAAAAKAGLAAL